MAATPNYLRQASQNLGKYAFMHACTENAVLGGKHRTLSHITYCPWGAYQSRRGQNRRGKPRRQKKQERQERSSSSSSLRAPGSPPALSSSKSCPSIASWYPGGTFYGGSRRSLVPRRGRGSRRGARRGAKSVRPAGTSPGRPRSAALVVPTRDARRADGGRKLWPLRTPSYKKSSQFSRLCLWTWRVSRHMGHKTARR